MYDIRALSSCKLLIITPYKLRQSKRLHSCKIVVSNVEKISYIF